MNKLRRLALACVIVGGVFGLFANFAAHGIVHNDKDVIILLHTTPENEKIGPFVVHGAKNKDWSLQLRSAQCERSIFMRADSVIAPPPEAFSALLYPSDKWGTLYVYRGQAYRTFARSSAYLHLLASRSIAALTMSPRDLSADYVFLFHIPAGCTIDPQQALAASKAVLGSIARTN